MDDKQEKKIMKRGNQLLKNHAQIYEQLIKIPEQRQITFHEEFKGEMGFGKPRFVDPSYKWDKELLISLRKYFDQLWDFFYDYNYYLDDSIMHLISNKLRSKSKKSIIFLLENDIWCTDEVYGKYLIEKDNESITINYYRFDTKIKEFKIPTLNKNELKEWIIRDAREQIKNQFTALWNKLEGEIYACMEQKYLTEPKIYLSDQYLQQQINQTKATAEEWPEAAILSLGRIVEILLLKQLRRKRKHYKEDLIETAHLAGKIQTHQKKVLLKIRTEYNLLKHNPFYKGDSFNSNELVQQFLDVIKI